MQENRSSGFPTSSDVNIEAGYSDLKKKKDCTIRAAKSKGAAQLICGSVSPMKIVGFLSWRFICKKSFNHYGKIKVCDFCRGK